jgi:hypothetical protein
MSSSPDPMMTCEELTELVTDYMERRLSLWETIRFQFHLGLCGPCREYLGQMETTRASLGHVEPVPMAEPLRDEMLSRFRSWKRTGSAAMPSPGGADPSSDPENSN